jgi:wyosine [tRNA(Phe)-imidazoG37] synthetase (radical SAM superfamily)
VEDNIQKLDSGIEETIRRIDCPAANFSLKSVVENLKKFQGKVIIQTLFLRGIHQGKVIDNTTETELSAWLKLLQEIKPSQVMIYTIARDTPAQELEKVNLEDLELIAGKIRQQGFEVQVSG